MSLCWHGHTYRLSGQCEGKTFFLDPCGLVERLPKDEAEALAAAPPPSDKTAAQLRGRVAQLEREKREVKGRLARLKKRLAAATERAEKARKTLRKARRRRGDSSCFDRNTTQARRKVKEAQRLAHAALRDARNERREAHELLLKKAATERMERRAEEAAHHSAAAEAAAKKALGLIREARRGLVPPAQEQ